MIVGSVGAVGVMVWYMWDPAGVSGPQTPPAPPGKNLQEFFEPVKDFGKTLGNAFESLFAGAKVNLETPTRPPLATTPPPPTPAVPPVTAPPPAPSPDTVVSSVLNLLKGIKF